MTFLVATLDPNASQCSERHTYKRHSYIDSTLCSAQLLVTSNVGTGLRTGPTSSNLDPLIHAASFFALDVPNVSVAAAAATNTILLWRIGSSPVVVFFLSGLWILGSLF